MYYLIGYSLGSVLSIGMAILVVVGKPRRLEAKLWALFSFIVSLWFLSRLLVTVAPTAEQAELVGRFLWLPTTLINPIYYHFCLALLDKRPTRLLRLGYAIAFLLGG